MEIQASTLIMAPNAPSERSVQPYSSESVRLAHPPVPEVAANTAPADRPNPMELPDVEDSSYSVEDRLQKVADQIREMASLFNKKLDFVFDKGTGRLVVRVMNANTNELIREMPPQKLLDLAAKIREDLGAIYDEFA